MKFLETKGYEKDALIIRHLRTSPAIMPPELRRAHHENDKAEMESYGFSPRMAEPEIVAELFRLYQTLSQN